MVFQGIRGGYIAWLVLGMLLLLLLFAALYLMGVSLFLVLPLVFGLGGLLFWSVLRLSRRFGAHGLMKYWAKRGLPRGIRFRSRRLFTGLKYGGMD